MAKLSPLFNDQTFIPGTGTPASGYKLFTYTAGSTTKQTTFTDAAGTTPQSNPIILNASGWPTMGPIWLAAGGTTKFVLAPPTDTDPPTSPVKTVDSIPGVNDTTAAAVSQWQPSGLTPTYVSTTSFTVPGDQTIELHVGRRVQFTTTGGTVYGVIASTAFAALTTVGMTMDSGQVLDVGLSVVNLSILRNDRLALPAIVATSGVNINITSLTGLTNMSAFFASNGTTASALAVATGYTEAFDVNNDFNPVTGVFTAPVAGVYEFGAAGQLPLNASRGMVTIIRVNGTQLASGGGCTEVANASPVNIRTPVTYLASLAAGNVVDVQLSLTGHTASICDYFWGKRIL